MSARVKWVNLRVTANKMLQVANNRMESLKARREGSLDEASR